ncbi:hypothetical protein GCM10009827_032500 [Dactylosporangium maewongense]|uniref:Uncharacterized protein n=1 Tax=Dactylosporangium maewongense TaxID=634393 RepID=A0ABN2ABE5_9ACTN
MDEDLSELLPRGLHRVEDAAGVHVTGVRDGFRVDIRHTGGAMVTRVAAAVPELQALGNAAGTLVPDAGAPPTAVAALCRAGSSWRDVRVSGGPGGLVAVRRSELSEYAHDLRLLETLATALGGTPA